MLEDPRLSRNNVRVPRREDYEKRPVLSATIHPDIKKTLVSMSERTGMSISQVTDEVLYAGLVEMQELRGVGSVRGCPLIHKVVLDSFMPRCFLRWCHQSNTLQVKIHNSCKTNRYTKSIKVLTYGEHVYMFLCNTGLISQNLVNIWEANYEKLLR